MIRVFFQLFIFSGLLFAFDTNTTRVDNFIDETHKKISDKVESMSNFTDDILSSSFDYTSQTTESRKESTLKSVDELFQNEKYIDETRKSYLRLSTQYNYESKHSSDINIDLRASVALSKSEKNLKLFMSGINQDNLNDITKKSNDSEDKPEFGLSIINDMSKRLESKYSLGIRSLSPFIRARFSYKNTMNSWKIEPVQTFEYSSEDEFKEETRVYFDKEILSKVLFRIEMGRGTKDTTIGMDYNGALSLFWTPEMKTGIMLSQSFYGNTKYDFVVDDISGDTKRFDGINNYITQVSFRQNIYRKWFFYEVNPSVSFEKVYDFEPNYKLLLKVEILFGKM